MRQTEKLKKIAAVIPCHNEAAGIGQVIAKFPYQQLQHHGLELQVYVVDNNSSDNTAEVARKAGATVVHESTKGKGNALRAGFRALADDIDYVVMLDGDDTYSSEELMRVIEPLRSDFCDVVVGSRLGGRISRSAMSCLNRFGNKLFTTAVRLLYRANVTDVLTGYFAWKKPVLDSLAPHIKSPGFAIEMEMITKMVRLGNHLASVPISYHPRSGESNLHPFKDGFRILMMLLKNLTWRPKKQSMLMPEPTVIDRAFTPRKIIFVSDSVYPYMKGGKEKRLHEITKRLAVMGHDVHIYTMHWWNSSNKIQIENGVKLHALCKYHKMYNGDRRTITEALLFSLACLKLLWVKFDVLDVDHMPFFPIFSAWIVCWIRGRKLYATWHEALSPQDWISYMGKGGTVAALVERLSIRLPHYITAASAQTKQSLASIHGRVRGVELVGSGVDTTLMSKIQSSQAQCDILYVGRLVKDKNVDVLLRAVKQITKLRAGVHCVVIGEGLEKQNLIRLARQLGIAKNVQFLGSLAEAGEVYAYMKAAKVFCSPSVREGFGIVSLEALACGTPVVTVDSPVNAARHLIENGQNGSIVTLAPEPLAMALQYWLSIAQKPIFTTPTAAWDWHQLAKKQAEVYML